MRWTERQRAMLQAFGVRLFEPPAKAAAPASAPAPESARAEAPTVSLRAAPVTAPARPATPALPVQRADVAVLGWDELRAAVAGCQACALSRSRRQTVFGVGHPHAHWMIVGEAPGEQEDRQGEPFVGVAGQLLDNMLRAVGLTRDEAPPERQVFIANTLKCRPPKNRNPEPAETAQCAPFLERQIALVQPRIILAMGRFAAQALLGSDEPLGKLRGRVHRVRGVPVVVTYHPAYLLRSLTDKARSWEDLCLAATVVRGS
jgi:uracil-DNA glycosylase